MAKLHLSAVGVSLLVLLASGAAAENGSTLPLKRVRLYEAGVGYFERSGALGGGAAELPVPTGHLDDALKTLVVLSDDPNASVAGLEFGSSVSRGMARAMAGLPGEEPLKMSALLRSLKGAGVTVKTKTGNVTGRLVELVEEEQSDLQACARIQTVKDDKGERAECVMQKHSTLVVLGKDGEIRRLLTDDIVSVKPTDKAFAARLGSALDSLGDQTARVKKDLKVRAKSGKNISLGYVAETPVWRTTYRLVLADGKDSGTLQGWALLHNDTDENWSAVTVELVNGQPDSFLFPLAAPRYARRELVTPENELSTVPQLMDSTADQMWGDEIGDRFGAGGLGLSGVGEGGGGRGEGIGLGSIGTVGHGAGVGTGSTSSALSVGNLAGIAQAEGVESGALFRYTLKSPVDLRAHGSALVPFVSDGVKARRIASFSAAGAAARSGVYLVHDGKQTLPTGPIAVFADGGFAGEASLDRMKPKESTIVEFGFDLDVELSQRSSRVEEETKLLEFGNGVLIEHYVKHSFTEYDIENRSGSGRNVFLTLKLSNNAKVTGSDEVAYDTKAGNALAVFHIGAREKKTRRVLSDEGLARSKGFNQLTSRMLATYMSGKSVPKSQKKILGLARERLIEAEVRRGGIKRRSAELADVKREVASLRAHARALRGTTVSGAEVIVKRLIAAEDQQKKLSLRITELKSEVREKTRAAERTLERLGRAR
jgi:hypothetical protein